MSQALYTPWPANARRTWGWGALGLIILTYGVSLVPVLIFGVILGAARAAGGSDPAAIEAALMGDTLGFVLPTILIQFFTWGLLIWLWARVFEQRGSETFGLRLSGLALLRFLVGLLLGVLLFVSVGVAALLLGAGGEGADALSADGATRLADPVILSSFAFIIVVFLIQGGAEEIIFRGWLMSTLAARWGVRAAVIVSSLVFMLFHAHVFISGLVFGLAALTGLGLMGLVFAFLSLVTRSIVEAIAAHGAFNAAAITAPTGVLLLEDAELTFNEALGQVFASATGTAGPAATALGPELLAQALAAGSIAALLAILLISRRRSPPFKELDV